LYSSMELVHLTLSGLNSVAAVTQRSRTSLRGQTPSALRRIRLLRSCLNHHGLAQPPGYTDRGYPVPDVVMRSRDPVIMDPVEEPGRVWSERAWFAHDPRCECCRRVAETGSG